MILVDTSVWVEHFRGSPRAADLSELLVENNVLLHPWVLGELALGGLERARHSAIDDLARLPAAPAVADEEVLDLISSRRLWGRGIGWVDVHLLASAMVARCPVWTLDGRLAGAAHDLGIAAASVGG